MTKPHMTLPNGDVIHEGGYGVTRDGRKVGPLRISDKTSMFPFEIAWSDFEHWPDVAHQDWACDGRGDEGLDIISAVKPAKDPNRPRPAHKLNLRKGDVVRHVGWDNKYKDIEDEITVGGGSLSFWLKLHIDTPLPKGQRPLFVVVYRAKGGK